MKTEPRKACDPNCAPSESNKRAWTPDVDASYLLICPTHRDERELARLGIAFGRLYQHAYASEALELIAGAARCQPETIADPLAEIEAIVNLYLDIPLTGVLSTDDYPGSTIASIVANRLGLPGPDPAANLLCQHKFYARQIQQVLTPEAVPPFALVQGDATPLPLPFFIKPVKSFFSIGAGIVNSVQDLHTAKAAWEHKAAFFEPFDKLFAAYVGRCPGESKLLAEGILSGQQLTLEGFVQGNTVHILGIVDSVFAPRTIAFSRFEYPSALPQDVQERMAGIASRVMLGLNYNDALFNIEFMYDHTSGKLAIIEINPRMASQFADLYEKVDGYNSYTVLLDLAAGRTPNPTIGLGRHAFAASCVLRRFEDADVHRVPGATECAAVIRRYPDARIEILATEGQPLSDDMQDGNSFRYGVLNLGGQDREDVLSQLRDCRDLLYYEFGPTACLVDDDSYKSPTRAGCQRYWERSSQ
jgi:biotin carboxylase